MKVLSMFGALMAASLLGGLAAVPAQAAQPLNVAGAQTTGANDDGRAQALWKQAPDGFAALPGNGLSGTTGGQAGRVVNAGTFEELKSYASAEEPLVILIRGSIKLDSYFKIPVASNKSFIGVGDSPELVNGGFKLINVSNVIFRNFTIRDSYIPGDWDGKTGDQDGIQLDTSHHVWVDHMAFERLGDGMIDTKTRTS